MYKVGFFRQVEVEALKNLLLVGRNHDAFILDSSTLSTGSGVLWIQNTYEGQMNVIVHFELE